MSKKMLSDQDAARLDELRQRFQQQIEHFVGYPCNQVFDYSPLYDFLSLSLNNVGDPYADSTFRLNTHDIEVEVLNFFGELCHAKPEELWGYVTNGGTEGNMYGIYLAREIFPEGMVYYSEDTHYSVSKIMRVVHARNIMIRSLPNGEIDYEDLKATIRMHRDVPPIIFANIGTTMKGAIDNIATIREILKELAVTRYYIHADCALSGMILPFMNNPPPFDFADGVHSLSISGHKMIGSPLPCGVVLATKKNVERVARSVEYVGSLDTTLAGSRSAITPLFLWYAIKSYGMEGFRDMVAGCLDTAKYAVKVFNENGIAAWRNLNSVTVVFPRPSSAVIRKWQLAVQNDIAHIITMPHVKQRHIDELLVDILRKDQEPT
ncbi:MAG: histidine decarboxylase [Gammaproteobacteria bacterium]|nr:histidine decarboxylase [Gammaproteobacteria bacterium]